MPRYLQMKNKDPDKVSQDLKWKEDETDVTTKAKTNYDSGHKFKFKVHGFHYATL